MGNRYRPDTLVRGEGGRDNGELDLGSEVIEGS